MVTVASSGLNRYGALPLDPHMGDRWDAGLLQSSLNLGANAKGRSWRR